MSKLHEPVLRWYRHNARDLPWRRPAASPWSVLVSEVMLQQTPVSRVLPVHQEWMRRWPTPADLAAEPAGEAIRAWGRLGYPRRALRLHAMAALIVGRHDGAVPSSYEELLALPGVGDYTAAAVASFAFGKRHVVLDTNVRRFLARSVTGAERAPASPSRAERDIAGSVLPNDGSTAAEWAAATMELGALLCTAARPDCARCPVADLCAWRLAGRPSHAGAAPRRQRWAGTDRQCRGRLLARLRDSVTPVPTTELADVWPDVEQRARCLTGLVHDGLATPVGPDAYALPG